ncbi:bcl-2-like protein 13 [Cololabis saira]|uniref:bcl-2-like protein 13 n=1 Tax=Cololabis saira TaxID=129043 RepID=UPI002AD41EB2|nr:bcl-2-like protein 13 [Cololabis saira]
MDLGGGVGERERGRETAAQLVHHIIAVPAPACSPACLLICGFVSECKSHFDLLLIRQLIQLQPERTEQPAFILEGKASVEPSRGDGGGAEARSLSPTSLPVSQAESSGRWQSESLLAESWSTMGDADPEDTKSLDSSDGAAPAGEENHSSNSDMVHLEREEAEMLEEAEEKRKRKEEEEEDDEELQASVLSVLGGEKELVELKEEDQDLQAPQTEELLVSAEEPHVERKPAEFRQVVPPMALPPLPIVKLDPPSTTSTPVPSTMPSEAEELYSTQGLHPPSVLAPMPAGPPEESLQEPKSSQFPRSDEEEHSVKEAPPLKAEPSAPKTKPMSPTELLFGGAALVAVVGVVAYGAVVYCKK